MQTDKHYTYPELTKEFLKETPFNAPIKELNELVKNMKKGYGTIITLNKEYRLKLQYHGRFKSFMIGTCTDFDNPNLFTLKLLRIETFVENTHNNGEMAFLGENIIRGPHIHWYNTFYNILNCNTFYNIRKPNKKNYIKLFKSFLENNKDLDIDINLLKKSISYDIFLRLHKLIIQENMKLREDGYITLNPQLKKNPKYILNQILNKELF